MAFSEALTQRLPTILAIITGMAKHTKQRERLLNCEQCGKEFITGSSIKFHCSVECRVASVAKDFEGVEGCWEWPGSRNPQTGYGQLSAWEDGKRKLYTAHRISFSALCGGIPEGQSVLHRCDNRPCFNPAHLFAGSQTDNMQDMHLKGRWSPPAQKPIPWQHLRPHTVPRGETHHLIKNGTGCLKRGITHHSAKITEQDVLDIRNSEMTLKQLSEIYKISPGSLSKIRLRQTWAHVA